MLTTQACLAGSCDVLVAVGGGSVIDAAKAIAVPVRAWGVGDAGHLPEDEVGEALAQVIASLGVAVGAPKTLREIGVTEPDLPAPARQTLDDAWLTTNPREVSEADVIAILQAAL